MLDADAELMDYLWPVEIKAHVFFSVLDPQRGILAFGIRAVSSRVESGGVLPKAL
jgi:hypothetical protein